MLTSHMRIGVRRYFRIIQVHGDFGQLSSHLFERALEAGHCPDSDRVENDAVPDGGTSNP